MPFVIHKIDYKEYICVCIDVCVHTYLYTHTHTHDRWYRKQINGERMDYGLFEYYL